jgi:hypothetical protein
VPLAALDATQRPARAGAIVPSMREACAAAARATGETPPVGSRRAGAAGFFEAFGLLAFEVTEVKKAHVSKSPKAERSCGPVTFVTPRVPTTCARTTRGETPRCRTLMRLKRPCR